MLALMCPASSSQRLCAASRGHKAPMRNNLARQDVELFAAFCAGALPVWQGFKHSLLLCVAACCMYGGHYARVARRHDSQRDARAPCTVALTHCCTLALLQLHLLPQLRYCADAVVHFQQAHGITFTSLSPFNEPASPAWCLAANNRQEGCYFSRKRAHQVNKLCAAAVDDLTVAPRAVDC